jgi:hypothetical protein
VSGSNQGEEIMPGELEIIIQKDGKIEIQVRGVKGKTCLNLTQKIEQQLGVVEKKQLSSEYSLTPTLINKQQLLLKP